MGIRALALGTVEGPALVEIIGDLGLEIVKGPGKGIIEGLGIESLTGGIVASLNVGPLVQCFLGSGPGPSIVSLVLIVLTTPGRFLSSLIISISGGSDPASSWGEEGNMDGWRGN